MNKSQQFMLSEQLEEINDVWQFVAFLVNKRDDTLTQEEVYELCKIASLLNRAISGIEKLSKIEPDKLNKP